MMIPRRAALFLILVLGLGTSQPALRGQKESTPGELKAVTKTYPFQWVERPLESPGGAGARLSPEVVADKDGSIRLAHSLLIADEMGATDFRQSETLNERIQAKKVFQLDSADVAGAELFLFGDAKKIVVNGKTLEKCAPLVSTGWKRARVPHDYLKAGRNEIVFSDGGSLLIEPGRPGHSFKSRDGGRTWSAEELGSKNNLGGEYLVRLRLGRYAPRGWAMSPILDLWITEASKIPSPWKIDSFKGTADLGKDKTEGTTVTVWLRTGSTPTPEERTWTDWRKLDKELKTDAATARHRWAQLKYELATTRPQNTPRLRGFNLEYGGTPPDDHAPNFGAIAVIAPAKNKAQPSNTISSVPFVYEQPSPRLKLLREKYHLDKVIAPGKTEMEQLMLLRYWVRNQCHRGWASHPALWIPPWDALLILESRDRSDCLVMCTHFSCIFTQCCLALGWNARHCILDHHCVSEVWVEQHRKWVMMDTGNSAERADVGLHFERGGLPLSARELHLLYRSGKTEGVRVCFTPARLMEKIASLCRPEPAAKSKRLARPDAIPLAELKKYPVCQLDNYRRYAFPARNNFLTTLYPGELEHGFSNYFYDGYCWVGDSADDPRISPEYSRHLSPERRQDIDWDLNWVRLHLSETNRAGEVQVDVETGMPNLARLEKSTSEGAKEKQPIWQATEARFVWKLNPGVNVLDVRGVNQWQREGRTRRVRLEWNPAK
jgi:hypothetical protein